MHQITAPAIVDSQAVVGVDHTQLAAPESYMHARIRSERQRGLGVELPHGLAPGDLLRLVGHELFSQTQRVASLVAVVTPQPGVEQHEHQHAVQQGPPALRNAAQRRDPKCTGALLSGVSVNQAVAA